MTHFSDADGDRGIAHQSPHSRPPRTTCRRAVAVNSAAVLRHSAGAPVRSDWVRAGILCYGSAPDFPATISATGPAATMTLRSRLIAVQQLQAATRWAMAAAGPPASRRASASSPAATPTATRATPQRHAGAGGRRAHRHRGRVSMDMLAVDLAPVSAAGIGSEVTLWGCAPGKRAGYRRRRARRAYHRLRAHVRIGTSRAGDRGRVNPVSAGETPWASSAPSSSASSSRHRTVRAPGEQKMGWILTILLASPFDAGRLRRPGAGLVTRARAGGSPPCWCRRVLVWWTSCASAEHADAMRRTGWRAAAEVEITAIRAQAPAVRMSQGQQRGAPALRRRGIVAADEVKARLLALPDGRISATAWS